MTDPVPSKDLLTRLRTGYLCEVEGCRCYAIEARSGCQCAEAADELERLQRQQTNLIAALGEAQAKIDELAIHAEKWVKRATTPGSLATKLGDVLVNRGIYDRMKDLTQEDTAERVVSEFLALANPIAAEHWHGGQVNQARELAASAYQDGYGAALTDDRDLSERTHELMRQLSRPAHEREPPHCSSCSCGMGNPLEKVACCFAGKVKDSYILKLWFESQEDLDAAFNLIDEAAAMLPMVPMDNSTPPPGDG